ncbi:hypothetical protein Pan181_08240 [Aeoliella mucimassa]|uniref:Bacterial type II and III secretion system protein n=2 Tax=Aeoliella mucimassa TaxID=2527972 RepID=A0A518AIT7_9BACT|nr:hypothetical protein Pan181_08240 [Aeoliella mucimassa]
MKSRRSQALNFAWTCFVCLTSSFAVAQQPGSWQSSVTSRYADPSSASGPAAGGVPSIPPLAPLDSSLSSDFGAIPSQPNAGSNLPAATPNSPAPATTAPVSATPAAMQPAPGTPPANNMQPANANNMVPVTGNPPTRARVTKGSGTLPRDHGQVWREYDISPYTSRVQNNQKPEQAVVDWILRETGYEAWHSEPLGILSASRETLKVYHTPELQSMVADIVDRFVNQQAQSDAFSLRVATVKSPDWRAKALPLMTPINVQSPGVQGWIMAKENAAALLADLTRRSDYREYNSPTQLVGNGQAITISTMRPRPYIKGVIPTPNVWPGFQPEQGQLEEGFALDFSPLLSLDKTTCDTVIKLRLHQVEKMVPVTLDIPTPVAQNQRMEVQVPQVTMANLHERFRWPTGHVLLLSMGVIGTPGPTRDNSITSALPMFKTAPRADALLFIEAKGSVLPPAAPNAPVSTANRNPATFQGRY